MNETVLLNTHNICFDREIRKLDFIGTFFLGALELNTYAQKPPLNDHDISRGAGVLNFALSLHLDLNLVFASSKSSEECAFEQACLSLLL